MRGGLRVLIVAAFTDANGKYTIRWQKSPIPATTGIKAALFARDEARNVAGSCDLDETMGTIDLRLGPALTLSGSVLDEAGGPLTNASVRLHLTLNKAGAELTQTVTDGQGNYEFKGLPAAGEYSVSAVVTGYSTANNVNAEFSGSQSNRLVVRPIRLVTGNLTVAGLVLGPDGEPVPKVWVNIGGVGQPGGNAMTDDTGHFQFKGVAPGRVTGSSGFTRTNGGERLNGSFQGQAGDTNIVIKLGTLRTSPSPRIQTSGTIFGPTGVLAAEIHLMILPRSSMNAVTNTDRNGSFAFQWQPYSPSLNGLTPKKWLLARDQSGNAAALTALDADNPKLVLRLQGGLTLSGSVRDAEGRAIIGSTLSVSVQPEGETRPLIIQTLTNDSVEGVFSASALPRGVRYIVRASAAGHGSSTNELSAAETQTGALELPGFVLKPANLQVAGQVLGPDGQPAWGATVFVRGEGQPTRAAVTTSSDGRFVIGQLCEGPVEVSASFRPGTGGPVAANTSTPARAGDMNISLRFLGR